MTKKPRLSDNVSGAVKALQEAMKPLPSVPVHVKLRECGLHFWVDNLRARARSHFIEYQTKGRRGINV